MGMGMGPKKAKLYLAAYNWSDDDDVISYASSLGYGVIRPNGQDLTVHAKANGK